MSKEGVGQRGAPGGAAPPVAASKIMDTASLYSQTQTAGGSGRTECRVLCGFCYGLGLRLGREVGEERHIWGQRMYGYKEGARRGTVLRSKAWRVGGKRWRRLGAWKTEESAHGQGKKGLVGRRAAAWPGMHQAWPRELMRCTARTWTEVLLHVLARKRKRCSPCCIAPLG